MLIGVVSSTSLYTLMHDMISSIKSITVRSARQSIVKQNLILLSGDVEVLIDDMVHVWADQIVINKNTQILRAKSCGKNVVSIETPYFLMSASTIFLNAVKKTGHATDVHIQMDGRYISAERAEKINDTTWRVVKPCITGCDRAKPDWSFRARSATLKKYLITISNPSFYVGSVPIFWLPYLITPAFSQAHSGFLIPQFSLDREFGFGLTQPYYFEFVRNKVDTTCGVHWRQKRGWALFNDFRQIAGFDSFTLAKILYARDWSLSSRCPQFCSRNRYWVEGKQALPISLPSLKLYTLGRVDFGTDKQIAFDFFNEPNSVDDFYWNTAMLRWFDDAHALSFEVNHEHIKRVRFPCKDGATCTKTQETTLVYGPRLSLSRTYADVGGLSNVRYDAFVDNAFLYTCGVGNLPEFDTVRWFFEPTFHKCISFAGNQIQGALMPNMQIRAKTLGQPPIHHPWVLEGTFPIEGACRLYAHGWLEWAFPTLIGSDDTGSFLHSIQPSIRWDFVPLICQKNWFHADEYDHVYAMNALRCTLQNSLFFNQFRAFLDCDGGYEWYSPAEIFPVRRASCSSHILPLRCKAGVAHSIFSVALNQEYNVATGSLLSLEMQCSLSTVPIALQAGWVYQNQQIQRVRGFLSDIPSFVHCDVSYALGKNGRIGYVGYFALNGDNASAFFPHIDVLLQRVRFDISGHCWGISLGLETKRYLDQGVLLCEQTYFFSFRLNTLGAFAKHFKYNPMVLNAPRDFVARTT